MREDDQRYREALTRIAELASTAIGDEGDAPDDYDEHDWGEEHDPDYTDVYDRENEYDHDASRPQGCTIRQLPGRLLVKAAETAIRINPANALHAGPVANTGMSSVSDPLRAAVVTAKYWGPQPRRLTVSFIERPPAELRRRIVEHMNAWSARCGIRFEETRGTGRVRITLRGQGYWSYLGTDILLIPEHEPTMGLEGFDMNTPESEFRRVVRHEAGHTLAMPHEHMRKELVARIDPARAYRYFFRTQRWDRAMVDAQVLTPLDQASIIGTPPDEDSIMCYQLPGEITRDGRPIRGGADINEIDYRFAARIYPRPGRSFAPAYEEDGWEQRFDVE